MKLTKSSVGALQLPRDKADAIYFDDDLPGFGVRLRAGGRRTWIVQFRVGARQRRLTIGNVAALDAAEARMAARKALARVGLGHDPQADKAEARAKAAITLGSVVDTYLNHKKAVVRPTSFKETDRYLRQHWKPMHGLPLHKIMRRNVATRLAEITAANGPVAAGRARSALSATFVWALGEGIAENNPVIGTNRPAEPVSRDRVLNDEELVEIWNACRDDNYGRIVRLLMLTGQRRQEVGAMIWPELDFDRAVWVIPSERTKNYRQHEVPLTDPVIAILKAIPQRTNRESVFGEGHGPFQGWSEAKAALDRRIFAARNVMTGGAGKAIAPWRLHDLRRTLATRMADLGVQPHVIEAVLNHVSGHKAGVAGVYNRSLYSAEKRAALTLWAEHIMSLVQKRESKIVPLRRN